jgi:hypothetical protein
MDEADEYKARAEEDARLACHPTLADAEREAFQRIVNEWLVLEAAARGRANRR